jgi:hypothetical protein
MAGTKTPELDLQREIQVHLETLRDLGPQYGDTVASSLTGHVERMVDERVDQRLARYEHRSTTDRTKIVAASLALGIPLTIIAGGFAHGPGIGTIWTAIIILNYLAFRR